MGRIGIYGGAFNPPHTGHVQVACYGVNALALDKLLLIPSCDSPHKPLPEHSPNALQRLEMLRLATDWEDKITVSDLEIRRGGTSYTFETLAQLREIYPEDELVLCMGTDMFLSFLSWREPERILKDASLAVFYRGDPGEKEAVSQQKQSLEKLGAKIYTVENPVTEISSTDLRRMLIFRCAGAYLTDGVKGYIKENNLYGTGQSLKNLSVEALEKWVVSLLKPNRVAHVLGCRDTAVELAQLWGANETHAARAALLHDITKALDGAHQLTICREYGIILDNFSQENPKTLHALTGSLVAERVFGESDEVVAAIASHTTGKENMNVLEKIIYVADYVEPNRNFPGVDRLRKLAYTDLNEALKLGLTMTLDMLKQQGKEISAKSLDALAYLNRYE